MIKRLIELGEVNEKNDEQLYWVSSGEIIGDKVPLP